MPNLLKKKKKIQLTFATSRYIVPPTESISVSSIREWLLNIAVFGRLAGRLLGCGLVGGLVGGFVGGLVGGLFGRRGGRRSRH